METATAIEERSDASSVAPNEDAERLINKASQAVLLAIGLAVLLATFVAAGVGDKADPGSDGARLGGDFPAFYAAGSIVWSGDIDSLYDPDVQQAAQADLGLDGYLAFAYPPHVAMAYAPLGSLSFQMAYVVHTLVMAAAFGLAIAIISPMVPLLSRWRWPLLAASFTFYPLITAVGGGQNASVSVLLLAVVWRALHEDRRGLAGVAIGLLAFRPQYAIPMIGLVLLARHWRAVSSAVATIAATWVVTAIARGVDWLPEWWQAVGPFIERDAEVNASNSISFLGFLQAALSADSAIAIGLGVALSAAVVATLMFLWANPRRFSLAQRMGAAAIGLILISPHTMFYDASLLLVAGAAVLAESTEIPVRVLAAAWLAGLSHMFAMQLGVTPLAVMVGAAFAIFVARTFTHAEQIRSASFGKEFA